MAYVKPDGPVPCEYAIIGEAPATEEVRLGKGFVGPSGKLLWPLLRRLAGLERGQCYVSNLCKHPLDNDLPSDEKMEAAEFAECREALRAELRDVRPRVVLAVGVLAAKALLGDDFTEMGVCNGMGFVCADRFTVVPTWHPAAALRGGGEDALAYTGDAIANLRVPRMHRVLRPARPDNRTTVLLRDGLSIGIDTEGLPNDPICLTWATKSSRSIVYPADVPAFWSSLAASKATAVYHNAPWDWKVLQVMGVPEPWRVPYRDTMELAYLRQVEPRGLGLKGLAYRHFRLRMREWEEVVYPWYFKAVTVAGKALVDAGITVVPRYGKKGQLLKKPQILMSDETKGLKRALNNPTLLAKRMGWWDGEKGINAGGSQPPSLRYVPTDEMVEYATLDPFATVNLVEVLQ